MSSSNTGTSASAFDGGAYYAAKNKRRWDTGGTFTSLNMSFNTTGGPRTEEHPLYAVGNNWVQQTDCAKAVHAQTPNMCKWAHSTTGSSCLANTTTTTSITNCLNATSGSHDVNYGLCSSVTDTQCTSASLQPSVPTAQNATPTKCSNTAGFKNTSTLSSVAFANDVSSLTFARATVRVRVSFTDSNVVKQTNVSGVALGPSPSTLWSSSKSIVGQGSAAGSDTVTLVEEDKYVTCFVGPKASTSSGAYVYGTSTVPTSSGTSSNLSTSDTVQFAYCRHPQQIANCANLGCASCNVFNINGYSTVASFTQDVGQSCCYNAACANCANMTINPGRMTKAYVYRPYTMFWYSVLGTGPSGSSALTVCEEDAENPDGTCVLCNGIVAANPDLSSTHFAYEPNPYASPMDSSSAHMPEGGPVLGVPVVYALSNSADGQAASEGSFLAQFLKQGTCSSKSVAQTYNQQCGWLALEAFYDSLVSKLDLVFAEMYYAYAVTQRFCLSLFQLAPFASIDGTTSAPLAFFMSEGEWAANVVQPYSQLSHASSIASSAMVTELSQPQIQPMDGDGNVTLTVLVPALLLGWLDDLDKVAVLVQRLFPLTDADTFDLKTSFDPQTAFDQITSLGPSLEQQESSVFQVVSASATSYFKLSTTSPLVPVAGTSPSKAESSTEVNVAALVEIAVKPSNNAATTLFYLYAFKRRGVSALPGTVSQYLAPGEPVPPLAPARLTWGAACQILESQACTNAVVYSDKGGWRVNSLFLSGDAQACKCVFNVNYPSTSTSTSSSSSVADHAWNPGAMCFNASCETTADLTVDLANLVAAAAAGSKCPAQSALATATVLNGQVVSVTVEGGGGVGYVTAPTVEFSSNTGTGAAATAVIDAKTGTVVEVVVTSKGSGYVLSPQVTILATPLTSASSTATSNTTTTSECASYCASYIDAVQSSAVSPDNVNLTDMAALCDTDVFTLFGLASGQGLIASPKLMAAGIVALAAMPVVYAAAAFAAVALRSTTKFSDTLAADPFFIVGVAVVQVLVAALFTYAWFDLDGIQVCGSVKSPDADGFSYPSSKCMSRGALQDIFPALAPYELPQMFCKQARLYCECSNNELLPCNTAISGCGCNTTQCCSANGLCASEELTDMPLTGRPLTTRVVDDEEEAAGVPPIETIALCVAAALVISPCVAIIAGAFTHGVTSPSLWWVPVLASATAFVVALGVCFVPLLLWYIDGTDLFNSLTTTTTYEVGVGACSSLPAYPEQVVVTSLTSGPVYYQQLADLDAQGLPQYSKVSTITTATSTNCSTCCAAYSSTGASSGACTASVCGDECLCQSLTTQLTASNSSTTACYSWPPSMLSYSVEAQAWTMYEPDNLSSSPQLFNVKTSSVVYQEPATSSTGTKPTMYTVFQDSDALAQNTLTVCGFYQEQSSCTACACSSLTTA